MVVTQEKMINWSFHKLSVLAEKLSLINTCGLVGIYKTLILVGILISLSLTIFSLVMSSPLIITLFVPLYFLNIAFKFIQLIFKRNDKIQKFKTKLLNLGDTMELQACQELLEILQVDGELKLGLFKDSPCVYKILYLESADSELIGFVEFFSRVGEEEHVCIEKLIMNCKYEGLGFTKVLVQALQELDVLSVEVWSLWRSEGFYKKLGFVDVVALSSGDSRKKKKSYSFLEEYDDSKNLKRVVGEFGPLLIWNAPISNV